MHDVLIIGGGPAGLAAGMEAAKYGLKPLILEKSDDIGGLCRTYHRDGFRFDVGGHRFFTKNREVRDLWDDLLGDDLLQCQRLSRIYYKNRFFHYPLQIGNAVRGLGILSSTRVVLSYLRARISPAGRDVSFEDWVSRRFGEYLYRTFFKTYTEKVWGIPCSELGADWAAQRIQNLSLSRAILDALPLPRGSHVKTLIKEFGYPRRGPGMFVDAMKMRIIRAGGEIRTEHDVTRVRHDGERVVAVAGISPRGDFTIPVRDVINTMPLSELIHRLEPSADSAVRGAAAQLRFRGFISVNLQMTGASPFPDQWIYIHEPRVKAGRVQSYGNWSRDMVPHDDCAGIGVEYFCFRHDEMWRMSDRDLVALAMSELEDLNLVRRDSFREGSVIRVPFAYPIYEAGYNGRIRIIRTMISRLSNLETAGRAGMFRYNNMDHSILTGLVSVRRLAGEDRDIWSINADDEYLEG